MAYLDAVGIHPPGNSVISRLAKSAHEVMDIWRAGEIPDDFRIRGMVTDFVNAWYLAERILVLRGTPFEPRIENHLHYIAKGEPQQLEGGHSSTERARLFELMAAATANPFATGIEFEEPDVVVTADGVRWGLACKSPSGRPQRIAKDIRKGIGQIEEAEVERGIVLVQVTNIFPHEEMLHEIGKLVRKFDTGDEAAAALRRALTRVTYPIEEARYINLRRYPLLTSGKACVQSSMLCRASWWPKRSRL